LLGQREGAGLIVAQCWGCLEVVKKVVILVWRWVVGLEGWSGRLGNSVLIDVARGELPRVIGESGKIGFVILDFAGVGGAKSKAGAGEGDVMREKRV
jgi:hypothetical protein